MQEPPDLIDRARRAAAASGRALLDRRRADGSWDAPIDLNAAAASFYIAFARTSGLICREGEAEREADLLRHLVRQVNADGGFYKYPGSDSSHSITRLALLAIRLSLGETHAQIWPVERLARNRQITPDLAAVAATTVEGAERFLRERPDGETAFERSHAAFGALLEAFVTGGVLPRGRAAAALRLAAHLARKPLLAGLPGALQPMFRSLIPACAILIECVDRRTTGDGAGWPSTAASHLSGRVRAMQNANGAWAYQPLFTILNLLALSAAGAPLDDDAVQRGVRYLHAAARRSPDGGSFFTFIDADVWTTASAALALVELAPSVVAADAAAASIGWLLAAQHGDGGFAFAAASANDPDTDSTGLALLTLGTARRRTANARLDAACARGLGFLRARQSRTGGFSSFERSRVPPLPVRDGLIRYALLDPPVPDVTARALTAMAALGLTAADPAVRRGLRFLLRQQRANGGWWTRWWAGYLSATGSTLYLFGDLGVAAGRPAPPGMAAFASAVERAVAFVVGHQNPDGGWGETTAADADESLAAIGPSSPLRTGTTLAALVRCGLDRQNPVVTRAVEYLLSTRGADGMWADHEITLTVFPNLFYYYHPVLPTITVLLALGEYLRGR